MGEHISCFGLTKPGPGSDVGGITRSAQKEGDHYVLSGEKMWITLSHLADRMLVFAKTDPDIGTRGIHYGIVGDLFDYVPALVDEVKRRLRVTK